MILSELRVGRPGECCICLERKLLSDLLALVPVGTAVSVQIAQITDVAYSWAPCPMTDVLPLHSSLLLFTKLCYRHRTMGIRVCACVFGMKLPAAYSDSD